MNPANLKGPVSPQLRALSGFILGLLVLGAAVQIFVVNSFDFDNMRHGTRLILQGVNPWAADTRIHDFYNPPFSALFLWPMLFTNSQVYHVIGGALLFAFVFYHKSWVGLAWFATNSLLWLLAAGGVNMFLIGAGLWLLLAADHAHRNWLVLVFRVLAYGLLMVKPQGGFFIVLLYVLLRGDWLGILVSILVYGLPFLTFYPDWVRVMVADPPRAQTVANHSILGQFGPLAAALVAALVLAARRWNYWSLGGALAGILAPYGMPGLPIFLTLTAVKKLAAIPVVILFSAGLAALTWITPPAGVDYYAFLNPRMAVYHLSMLGLALALACLSEPDEGEISIRPLFTRSR